MGLGEFLIEWVIVQGFCSFLVSYMKCPTEPPGCGLLRDNMSLMWGKTSSVSFWLKCTHLYEFTMFSATPRPSPSCS